MAITIGCMTVTTFKVIKNIKETVHQTLYLHSTKGWRRGPKQKKITQIRYGDWEPRAGGYKRWEKY